MFANKTFDSRRHLGDVGRGVLLAVLLLLAACVAQTAAAAATSLRQTPIGELAARLKPGEFGRLASTLPPGVARFGDLLRVKVDEKRRLEIDTWTDSAHWDPRRQRSFFLGQRIYKKFISYDATSNAWTELGWAGSAPSPQTAEYGHTYGRTALDWKRGHYYRLAGDHLMHRYLIDEARWEEISGVPVGSYISMEWHYGLDMLVAVARGGKVFGFRDGNWKLLGRGSVDGYHSIAQYNPVRGDMMAAGGNLSLRRVDIIDAHGEIHSKRDAPFDIAIKDHSLSYDPQSGNYLILRLKQREMYEYDPDRDEWRQAASWGGQDWPFGNFHSAVPIEIDELGVVLWQSALGPQVYRHRSVFEAPVGGAAAREASGGALEPNSRPAPDAASKANPPTAARPHGDDAAAAAVAPVPAQARASAENATGAAGPRAATDRGGESDAPAVASPHLPPPSRIINEPGRARFDRPAPTPVPAEPKPAPVERNTPPSAPPSRPEAGARVSSPSAASSPAAAIARSGERPAARPSAPVEPPAKLARILEGMKPGEWRPIRTVLPEGHATLYDTLSIEFCPLGSGKRTHGNGWLDSFVYDPASRSFFVLLMRDSSEKRLAWLDADLAWHFVRNPPGIGSCAFNRRPFNRLTLVDGQLYWLPSRWGANRVQVGKFMRAPVADFVKDGSGTFEPYGVGVGITSMGQAGDYAVEWFPEAAAWILHLPGNDTRDAKAPTWSAPSGHTVQGTAEEKQFLGRLFLYRPGDTRWTYLDRTYSQGYRSRILYNPIKHELLVAPGGYGPSDEFTRITAAGEILKLDRAQLDTGTKLDYHTGRDNLTYDPVSGDYLLWSYGSKRIWRSGDGVRWRTYEDFSTIKFNGPEGVFGASSFIQVNPIPSTDGLIWFDPHRGVILHRMRRE